MKRNICMCVLIASITIIVFYTLSGPSPVPNQIKLPEALRQSYLYQIPVGGGGFTDCNNIKVDSQGYCWLDEDNIPKDKGGIFITRLENGWKVRIMDTSYRWRLLSKIITRHYEYIQPVIELEWEK